VHLEPADERKAQPDYGGGIYSLPMKERRFRFLYQTIPLGTMPNDYDNPHLAVDDIMSLTELTSLVGQGFILDDLSLQAEFSTYFTD
jgi:hypothetical protein